MKMSVYAACLNVLNDTEKVLSLILFEEIQEEAKQKTIPTKKAPRLDQGAGAASPMN